MHKQEKETPKCANQLTHVVAEMLLIALLTVGFWQTLSCGSAKMMDPSRSLLIVLLCKWDALVWFDLMHLCISQDFIAANDGNPN